MWNILCFGDSNTYGYSPYTAKRFDRLVRWPGRLAAMLGEEYYLIEEGCNGRTTSYDDRKEPWKNGMSYLYACLHSHKPIDLVILMLGSNDCKNQFDAKPEDIAANIARYIKEIRSFLNEKQGFIPEFLVMAPAAFGERISEIELFKEDFDEESRMKSLALPGYLEKVAKEEGCHFLDVNTITEVSGEDQLHFDEEGHRKLADAVYDIITHEVTWPGPGGIPASAKVEKRVVNTRTKGKWERSNIILTGMPASGKSTSGVILAKLLGYNFIDTDLAIQNREGRCLHEIIADKGIKGFLEIEEAVCLDLETDHCVIATGGSVVYSQAAMAHLKALGCVTYLKVDYDVLMERLRDIKERGVVLQPRQTIKDLYEERTILYEKYADVTVPEGNSSLEETIGKIFEQYILAR